MDTKEISKAINIYYRTIDTMYNALRSAVEENEIVFKTPIIYGDDKIITIYYDSRNADAYIKTAKGVLICTSILTADTLYLILRQIEKEKN